MKNKVNQQTGEGNAPREDLVCKNVPTDLVEFYNSLASPGADESVNAPTKTASEHQKARDERAMVREITSLLISLKGDIDDDFRASDDPEDNQPGMQVTVSTADMQSWNYQTGDNSYSGGCYGDPHWSVIYLYRRSNCKALAQDAVNELADECAQDESE